MPTLTRTTWTIREISHPFAAKFAGKDALTGFPFMAWEQVRLAVVNGVKSTLTQRDMRLLDLKDLANNGVHSTDYTMDLSGAEAHVADPRVTHIRVMSGSGKVSTYGRQGSSWYHNGSRSAAQLLAHIRKSHAYAAEVSFKDAAAIRDAADLAAPALVEDVADDCVGAELSSGNRCVDPEWVWGGGVAEGCTV